MILAADVERGIWIKNTLPWNISEDLKYFKNVTTKVSDYKKRNAVIMWRKTWESIPDKYKPLPDRENFVLSRQKDIDIKWAKVFDTIEKCLSYIWEHKDIENIFIIWWAKIYDLVLYNENLERIYLTKVLWNWWCDTFFRGVPKSFELTNESEMFENKNHISYQFQIYDRKKEAK